MALKDQIDQDIKKAMLGGDKTLATILRGLKSSILYEEVAKGLKEKGLTDEQIKDVLSKEVKKRTESAGLYEKGGDDARKSAELAEKAIIEKYLPKQLSREEISEVINDVEKEKGPITKESMGIYIGEVKKRVGSSAEGAVIAELIKARLG